MGEKANPAYQVREALFISLHAIVLRLSVICILCLQVSTSSKPPLTHSTDYDCTHPVFQEYHLLCLWRLYAGQLISRIWIKIYMEI